MYTNPYELGGWRSENPNSQNREPWTVPAFRQPSMTGALPSLDPPVAGGRLVFRYHTQYRDIRNSTLLSPNGTEYLDIVSDSQTTYFRKNDMNVLATIEWSGEPKVYIRGLQDTVPVRQWLPAERDGYKMFARDRRPFIWVREAHQTSLYAVGSAVLKGVLASITRSSHDVTLFITSDAIQAGLLESAIVATVLLMTYRN